MNNIMEQSQNLGKANKMKKLVVASAMTSLLGVGLLFGGNAEASEHTYTVKSGDTLNQIAQTHKVELNDLVKFNNLEDKNLIFPGQSIKLNLDSGAETKVEDKEKESAVTEGIYTVKSGDTLSTIGKTHNVSVDQLKTWNNLSSDLIFAGQELSVSSETAKESVVYVSYSEQATQPTQTTEVSSVAPSVVEYETEETYTQPVQNTQTQSAPKVVEQVSSVAPTPQPQQTQTTQSTSNSGLNWGALAACESGGNASVVSANGLYHGLYQFDAQTWQSVGGSGVASDASAAEQTKRAQMLYDSRGSQPWPVCGARL